MRLRITLLVLALAGGAAFVLTFWLTGIAGPPGPTEYRGPRFPPVWSIAAGDLDGDGADDFALGGRGASSDRITLLLRVPEAPLTFDRAGSLFAGNAVLQGLAFGDVDGDGRLDVVAGHGREVAVFFRDPDGTYQRHLVDSGRAYGLLVTDADGDERAEIVVIALKALKILAADATSPRTLAPRVVAEGDFRAVAAGDLDGDGLADLAASRRRPGAHAVVVLRQDPGGAGTFTPIAEIPTPRWVAAIAIGAVDAGARSAIVFARGRRLWIARNDPESGWLAGEELLTSDGGAYRWLAIRDMDEDGAADVVIQRGRRDFYSTEAIVLLRQDPLHPGQFLEAVHCKTPVSVGTALGDFDGDGLTDVVVSSQPPKIVLQDPAAPGRLLRAQRIHVVRSTE